MRDVDSDLAAVDDALATAVADVEPPELGRYAREAVESSNPNPALLCTFAARRCSGSVDARDAVGVQLLHTGLGLTRGVVNDPDAWDDVGTDVTDEDMELLAADVLVTLGFDRLIDHYDTATRIVNAFGRETARATLSDDPAEVIAEETAALTATYRAAVEIGADGSVPDDVLAVAEALAAADCLRGSRAAREALATLADGERRREAALDAVTEALDATGVDEDYSEAFRSGSVWSQQRPRPGSAD